MDDWRANGWDVEYVAQADHARARRELHRRLAANFKNFPRTPMPHGRFNDYMWSLFDANSNTVDIADWLDALMQIDELIILPENPSMPAFSCQPQSQDIRSIPQVDAYLLPASRDLGILAVSHETPHYWYVESSYRSEVRGGKKLAARTQIGSPPALTLDELQSQKIRGKLRSNLRKKWLYIPEYDFATSGPSLDFLWNYLPREASVASLSKSVIPVLLAGSSQIAVWNESDSQISIFDSLQLAELNKLQNHYLLDWPEMRWLIAIPNGYKEHGDNDHLCSVILW